MAVIRRVLGILDSSLSRTLYSQVVSKSWLHLHNVSGSPWPLWPYPHCSWHSSDDSSLLAALGTWQASSCFRAFALTFPSTWKVLALTINRVHPLTSVFYSHVYSVKHTMATLSIPPWHFLSSFPTSIFPLLANLHYNIIHIVLIYLICCLSVPLECKLWRQRFLFCSPLYPQYLIMPCTQ